MNAAVRDGPLVPRHAASSRRGPVALRTVAWLAGLIDIGWDS